MESLWARTEESEIHASSFHHGRNEASATPQTLTFHGHSAPPGRWAPSWAMGAAGEGGPQTGAACGLRGAGSGGLRRRPAKAARRGAWGRGVDGT